MKTFPHPRTLAMCTLVLFLAMAMPASANLIVNGDFETQNFTGWTVTPAPTGSFIFVAQDAAYHSNSYGAFFGATGSNTDSLSQSFATTAGALYNLSFFLQIGPTTAVANNFFEVLFNGVVIFTLTNANPGFATFTFNSLMATSGMTTLEFRGRNLPAFDFLDDVVVEAATGNVPDPGSSLLLMSLAVTGLAGGQRIFGRARTV